MTNASLLVPTMNLIHDQLLELEKKISKLTLLAGNVERILLERIKLDNTYYTIDSKGVCTFDKYKLKNKVIVSTKSAFINSNITSFADDWFPDMSQCTNMRAMFNLCDKLQSLDVSKWDTSNVTNMQNMFGGCTKLQSLDVSNWNTSNVINMSYMFSNCGALQSITFGDKFIISTGTGTNNMLQFCSSLSTIICTPTLWSQILPLLPTGITWNDPVPYTSTLNKYTRQQP